MIRAFRSSSSRKESMILVLCTLISTLIILTIILTGSAILWLSGVTGLLSISQEACNQLALVFLAAFLILVMFFFLCFYEKYIRFWPAGKRKGTVLFAKAFSIVVLAFAAIKSDVGAEFVNILSNPIP